MKESVKIIFEELFCRYPALTVCKDEVLKAYEAICETYEHGGCLFACGNGGSCSDSEHIIGELLKSFKFKRKIDPSLAEKLSAMGETGKALADTLEGSLPAVSLCGHPALTTAFLNDTEPMMTFAQQLLGLGKPGDTLIVISTSGNSKNCVYAATLAKAMGIKTVAMTGERESNLSDICDVTIRVPEMETFKVQEMHLPVYHALCAMTEETFFENTHCK
ncbi:MAG: SIS domain-containing protein [Ruminococcaceae bacterium]|nr:SIS domain-containing protein [Oscillospiraceae bacterium]